MIEYQPLVNRQQYLGFPMVAAEITILTVYEKLYECLDKLAKGCVCDDATFELELLATQLRIRLHAGIYDPLKKVGCPSSHVCRFLVLVDELNLYLGEADTRTSLVTEIISLAKAFLRKEGIPFRT
jgi:hypothetical protein